MAGWWERTIIEPGKLPLLLTLLSFVLTFAVVRAITRMLRAGRGPFHDLSAGGTHVHHVVPGVVLMVVGGFTVVASGPHDLVGGAGALLFGVGVGLVLDEFALILYLQDVYWSERGRRSVEMVLITAALVGLVLVGALPFDVADMSPEERRHRGWVVANVVANFLFALVTLAKGKPRMAVLGVFVPFVALVGAVRLARPGSWWYRRCYRRRAAARARAERHAEAHDARWVGLRRRFQDLVAGAPDR